MNLLQFLSTVEIGMIFALVAIGVYLSFRVLDFPDLTADGSFPLGAAVAAILIVQGYDPWVATGMAFAGGAVAGFVTAYLNVRFNILSLLASILTMTALYSINLRIMGRPNIAMLHEKTVFTPFETLFGDHLMAILCVGAFFVLVIAAFVFWVLQSEWGLGLRATGANPIMARAHGVNTNKMILIGIALSNGIIAFAGALFAQSQGFADVNMGTGTLIVGLASVIIGEVFLPRRLVILSLIGCVIGSILYRLSVSFALNAGFLGLLPSDLNLIMSFIIVLAMVLPKIQQKTAANLSKS
jgi:putative ABC transport system permease protein